MPLLRTPVSAPLPVYLAGRGLEDEQKKVQTQTVGGHAPAMGPQIPFAVIFSRKKLHGAREETGGNMLKFIKCLLL